MNSQELKDGKLFVTVTIARADLFDAAKKESALKGKYTDTYAQRLTDDEKSWFDDQIMDVCRELYPVMSAYQKGVPEAFRLEELFDEADPPKSLGEHFTWILGMGDNYDGQLAETIERNIKKVVVTCVLKEYYKMTKNQVLFEEALQDESSYAKQLIDVLHMRKGTVKRGCSVF